MACSVRYQSECLAVTLALVLSDLLLSLSSYPDHFSSFRAWSLLPEPPSLRSATRSSESHLLIRTFITASYRNPPVSCPGPVFLPRRGKNHIQLAQLWHKRWQILFHEAVYFARFLCVNSGRSKVTSIPSFKERKHGELECLKLLKDNLKIWYYVNGVTQRMVVRFFYWSLKTKQKQMN